MIVCFCLPGILLFYYLYNIEKNNIKDLIVKCIYYTILVNGIMMAANAILGGQKTWVMLIQKSDYYALVYMVISTILVWLIYYVYENVNRKVEFKFDIDKTCNKKALANLFYVSIIILFVLQLVCIKDRTFNVDEIYSIRLVQYNIPKMIEKTANDVHPPLYYLILKFFCEILGYKAWVYHFVSLIPVFLSFVFSATCIRKKFGMGPALVFAVFLGMSEQGLRYNMEVRMYSFAALFVLLSFWELRNILADNKTATYIKYVCFSLLAAYTHYYALITVAFLYVVMFFYMFTDKKRVAKTIIACVITVVAYLPWLHKMSWRKAQQDVKTANFQMPTVEQTVDFLYSGLFNGVTILIVVILLAIIFCYESRLLAISEDDVTVKIKVTNRQINITHDSIWIFAGIISGIGLYLCGKVLTDLIKPMFSEKYLYNYIMIAWMLIIITLSKLKCKNVCCGILIFYMIVIFASGLYDDRISNISNSKKIERTMETVSSKIDDVDEIITDISHVRLGIGTYYFYGSTCKLIDDYDFSTVNKEKTYLMIMNKKMDDETAFMIKSNDLRYEIIVEDGYLGNRDVNIYKLEIDVE